MPKVDNLVAAVLDTHVWVWCAAGDPRAAALADFKGRPIVSAISVWEVAMLESRGRLQLEPDVDTWVDSTLAPPVALEPISPAICVESCRMPGLHGDPADRLIVATSVILGLPLITADENIRKWNEQVRRIPLVPL